MSTRCTIWFGRYGWAHLYRDQMDGFIWLQIKRCRPIRLVRDSTYLAVKMWLNSRKMAASLHHELYEVDDPPPSNREPGSEAYFRRLGYGSRVPTNAANEPKAAYAHLGVDGRAT